MLDSIFSLKLDYLMYISYNHPYHFVTDAYFKTNILLIIFNSLIFFVIIMGCYYFELWTLFSIMNNTETIICELGVKLNEKALLLRLVL